MRIFSHKLGVVEAKMVYAPTDDYFFAVNGDPRRQIRCHRNQGGKLKVVDGRLIIGNSDEVSIPLINDGVALIRRSYSEASTDYTIAVMWVPIEDWHAHKWAVNLNENYRAIAHNHKINGDSNRSPDLTLIEGPLNQIMLREPRRPNDPLSEGHMSQIGDLKFSYSVRWERWAKDMWVESCDPRPPSTY